MVYLILLCLLAVTAVIATTYLISDPGYIFIQLGTWQVELTFAFGLFVVLSSVILLYLGFELIFAVVTLPKKMRKFLQGGRKDSKSQLFSSHGLIYFLEEDWASIQKLLERAANQGPDSTVTLLAAAYSAQKQGNTSQRDEFLAKAKNLGDDHIFLIELFTARLLIEALDFPDAIYRLKLLCSIYPRNKTALKLLIEAYKKSNRWSDLQKLFPQLRKAKVYPPNAMNQLTRMVTKQCMQVSESAGELFRIWKKSPTVHQNQPEFAATYVRKLLEFNRHEEAEKVLRRTLNMNWDSDLVQLYGLIGGSVNKKHLYSTVLAWLKTHADDKELLLAAAKFARTNDNTREAKVYLDKLIANGGRREAYEELGDLLIRSGKPQTALDVYRKGVAVITS